MTEPNLGKISPNEASARTPRVLWMLVVVCAGAQAWVARHSINPDGVGYLDQSDQILSHGLGAPINGYWSPLYPALLALGRGILGTSAELEWPVAHVVNFFLCLVAFACAEWFRRELVKDYVHVTALSALCVAAAGWAAVSLITLNIITPDLAVLASVMGATAGLLRWRRGSDSWSGPLFVGVALGLGYLAKSVMFVVALMYLVVAFVATLRRLDRGRGLWIAALTFGAIAAPQVIAVSTLHGAPTFGRTGALAYAWYVGRVPGPLGPEFVRPAEISAASGVSLISEPPNDTLPRMFVIDGRTPGTFPLWSDVTRWYPHTFPIPFNLVTQVRQTARGIVTEIESFWPFAVALILAWAVGVSFKLTKIRTVDLMLLAAALLPLLLYALVHVEKRLIAPFVVLVVLCLGRKFANPAPVLLLALAALLNTVSTARADIKNRHTERELYEERAAIASFVRKSGGNRPRVVIFGDPYEASTWARLSRARLVAIVDAPEADQWWLSAAAGRRDIEAKLKAIPGVVVVSAKPPAAMGIEEWTTIPGAPGYVTRTTPFKVQTQPQ